MPWLHYLKGVRLLHLGDYKPIASHDKYPFWAPVLTFVNIPLTSTLFNVLALYVYLKPNTQGESSPPNLGVPNNLKFLVNVKGKVIVPLPLLFNE